MTIKISKLIKTVKLIKQFSRKLIIVGGIGVVIFVGAVVLWKNFNKKAEAAWFDDTFVYRNPVDIASHTAAENNVYVAITIDTSANVQADCGDLRWTDVNGKLLKYYVVSGCTGASTVINVFMDTMPAGRQTLYYYYGNPNAPNGFQAANFATAAQNVGTITVGAQETTQGPISYWKLDDGTGTVASNSVLNNPLTLNAAVNNPTWQTEDMCVSGKCLYFEGSNATASAQATTISNIKSVSFWVKPASTSGTIPLISFSYGTGDIAITSSNLALSAPGITSPTYYVNGVATTTLTANNWNHIVVTSGTAWTATNMVLGKIMSTYFQGFMDSVKLYPYVRTIDQVKLDYNTKSAGTTKGNAALFGAQTTDALNQGLVGYWKLEDVNDSSGNGNTLTNNGGLSFTAGKFGSGANATVNTKYLSTTTAISGVKTVAFWINPTATTTYPIDLNGTQTITATTGTIAANSFTGAKIYVNGAVSSTLVAGSWQHVVVTTDTSFNTGTMTIGLVGSNTMNGTIDEVRIYNRALSPAEVSQLYNFAPGPEVYWNFEEGAGGNASDISGNGFTGTATGTTVVTGKYGKARNFTASDTISNTSITNPAYSNTVEAWVYPTANNKTVITNLAIDSSSRPTYGNCVGTALTLNTWTHIAGVSNGSGVCQIYQNGILSASNTTGVTFGTTLAAGVTSFLGKLDEVKLYNYPRSQKQIIEDINGGHPAPGSPVGSPAVYYKFDEGGGPWAYDSGYTRNDGCLPGGCGTANFDWGYGKFGFAVEAGAKTVDGSGSPLFLDGLTGMTLSFWINPVSLATDANITSRWKGSYANFLIKTDVTTSSELLICIANDPSDSACGNYYVTSGLGLTAKTWQYLTIVYDGTQAAANRIKVYKNKLPINGSVASGTIPTTMTTVTTNAVLKIGTPVSSGGVNTLDAFYDEYKIFTFPLTTDQIIQEFNHGSSTTLGSFSDTSQLTGGTVASNSATATLCVPGDSNPCNAPFDWWTLNENRAYCAFDWGSSKLDGALGNNPPVNCMDITSPASDMPTWSQGKIGSALKFDGTDDFVNTSTNLGLNGGTKATWMAWIKRRAINSWVTMGDQGSKNGLTIEVANDGLVYGAVGDGSANDFGTFPSNDTNWHHVVFVYDGTQAGGNVNMLRGYLDGVQQSLDFSGTTIPSSISDATGPFVLGMCGPSCTGEFTAP